MYNLINYNQFTTNFLPFTYHLAYQIFLNKHIMFVQIKTIKSLIIILLFKI